MLQNIEKITAENCQLVGPAVSLLKTTGGKQRGRQGGELEITLQSNSGWCKINESLILHLSGHDATL